MAASPKDVSPKDHFTQAFDFEGASGSSILPDDLRAIDQGGGAWRIEADVDGDTIADVVIGLTSAVPITVADFVL